MVIIGVRELVYLRVSLALWQHVFVEILSRVYTLLLILFNEDNVVGVYLQCTLNVTYSFTISECQNYLLS